MAKAKRKKRAEYRVSLQFEAYDMYVTATSAPQAREIALARLTRKGLRAMIDKQNSSTEKL